MSKKIKPLVYRIPITKARVNLGQVVRRVHLNKEFFILEKDGIPVAGLIGVDEMEAYLEQRDPGLTGGIREAIADYGIEKGLSKKEIKPGTPRLKTKIHIPKDTIAEFCRKHRIRKLSFFGSVLRDDFSPDSDVDVLVGFEPGVRIGLIGLARIENELSGLIGRKVDVNTTGSLSPYFRDKVLEEAEVAYEQA